MKEKDFFYIEYAKTTCKIYSSYEWRKYLKKLYNNSSILEFSEKKPKTKLVAEIFIKESNSKTPQLKFMTHKKNLLLYEIVTSKHALFFFPTVHQFIARIFNILFHLNGGFVLHASSLLMEKNKTLVFAGQSGRGKSTIVDIIKNEFPDSKILSDNSAFILKKKSSFVLYPSPYLEANRVDMIQQDLIGGPFLVSAIYFPFHSKKNSVEKLSFSEKMDLIQKNSHIPYSSDILFDEKAKKNFAKTIFAFVSSEKIYKFNFVKSNSFVKKLSFH